MTRLDQQIEKATGLRVVSSYARHVTTDPHQWDASCIVQIGREPKAYWSALCDTRRLAIEDLIRLLKYATEWESQPGEPGELIGDSRFLKY